MAERGFCREPTGSKETCGGHVAATQDSGASGGRRARSRPGQQGCLAAVSRQPDSCGRGGGGGAGCGGHLASFLRRNIAQKHVRKASRA